MDEIDFSEPSNWSFSRCGRRYIARGGGFVACIFPSTRPAINKFGGWLKYDRPSSEPSDTLALYWSDSLHELFLRLELAKRRQTDHDQASEPTDNIN